jgi:hypothetical protein
MSIVNIRAALETRLNAMTPALATAWEGVPYTPVTGTPYQQVNMLLSATENPTFGDAMYRVTGFLQVLLCYPPGTGPKAAATRAELVRDQFRRGLGLSSGGTDVLIDRTPTIAPAIIDGDRYRIPVTIYFSADIFPS